MTNLWFVDEEETYFFRAIGSFIIGKVKKTTPVAALLEPGAVWVRNTGPDPSICFNTGEVAEFFHMSDREAIFFHNLQGVSLWKHSIPSRSPSAADTEDDS